MRGSIGRTGRDRYGESEAELPEPSTGSVTGPGSRRACGGPEEARPSSMSVSELLSWQWQGYPRYHRSRLNLLVHIIVVPMFLMGNVALLVGIVQGSWLVAGLAGAAMVASVALQGAGHRRESVLPEPFESPLDGVSRIVCEQWVTFPRFVASGGWLQAWRQTSTT